MIELATEKDDIEPKIHQDIVPIKRELNRVEPEQEPELDQIGLKKIKRIDSSGQDKKLKEFVIKQKFY